MTPDEVDDMLVGLHTRKERQEVLLAALSAPDVDIDAIIDNRDKSPNWVRLKSVEPRHREELLLRADISRLDKHIDARIKALHAQKNHIELDEPTEPGLSKKEVSQMLNELRETKRELQALFETLDAPDVNVDDIANRRDRSPQSVRSKPADPHYHEELMLRRDISQLNQAINARLSELRDARNKGYVEKINTKYKALLQERETKKEILEYLQNNRDKNLVMTELEQRSELRNDIVRLSNSIRLQETWVVYFNQLIQEIEKREAYLATVEALSSLGGDKIPTKPEPSFEAKNFINDEKGRPVNDTLVAKLAVLNQKIDARVRLLTTPMRGGSPHEVRDKTEKTRRFFKSVDTHFDLFRAEFSKSLTEKSGALEDILSQLNGLQAALNEYKIAYLNTLKEPVQSDESQIPLRFDDFYKQCADTLNEFIPKLKEKAAQALPVEQQAATLGWFSGLLKWFSDAWAATFSTKSPEPVSARTTAKEARSAEISRQFKGRVQDFITEQENKKPNQQNQNPEATSDDAKPQL